MAGRAKSYRAIVELLRDRPSADAIDDARAILRGAAHRPGARGTPVEAVAAALAAVEVEDLRREWDAVRGAAQPLACAAPNDAVRAWACVAAQVAPDAACATDLRVLGALTERCVWAAKLGDPRLAAATYERRYRFLVDHAAWCASAITDHLVGPRSPTLALAARALAWLLADDWAEAQRAAALRSDGDA